jgi:hypothetical protein
MMEPRWWSILGAVVGGLIGFGAAVFAEPLRRWIYRPKLQLEFGSGAEYQAPTDEGVKPNRHKAIYIRIKVTNTKAAIAKSCRAYLVAIDQEVAVEEFKPTIYCDSIPIAWACRDDSEKYAGLDLPKGVAQFIDVISTRSVNELVSLHLKFCPYRYSEIYQKPGTYRFTIQVSGENVEPTFIRIVYCWTGSWDKYGAYKG